jgi:hypothetical protein
MLAKTSEPVGAAAYAMGRNAVMTFGCSIEAKAAEAFRGPSARARKISDMVFSSVKVV